MIRKMYYGFVTDRNGDRLLGTVSCANKNDIIPTIKRLNRTYKLYGTIISLVEVKPWRTKT